MSPATGIKDLDVSQLYTVAVAGAAASFFLWSAFSLGSAQLDQFRSGPSSSTTPSESTPPSSTSSSARNARRNSLGLRNEPPKKGKTTDQSTVQVTYPTTLEMCDNAFYSVPSPSRASDLRLSTARPRGQSRSHTQPLSDIQVPKTRAGALLKLIDVVAGVSARKHAQLSCVTVSVDSVLLLAPIYLGDLVHLSASVNRAWGSSLEVGVRVVKEDPRTGAREYVSHAYMTFVAVSSNASSAGSHGSPPQPPARVRLASRQTGLDSTSMLGKAVLWLTGADQAGGNQHKAPKPQLEPLIPQTPLEARRHILAGRRRAKRIANAQKGEARDGVSNQIKERLKEEVLEISRTGGKWKGLAETERNATLAGWTPGRLKIEPEDLTSAVGNDVSAIKTGSTKTTQESELEALELEFVVQAYISKDPAVTVKEQEGLVEVNLSGDIPIRHPLRVVQKLAKQVEEGRTNRDGASPADPLFASSKIPEADARPLPSPSAPGVLLHPDLDLNALQEMPTHRSRPMGRRRSIFSPLKPAQDREGDTDWDHSGVGTPIKTVPTTGFPTSRSDAVQALQKLEKSASRDGFTTTRPIKVAKTMARTLHLVFPEHTNSVGVLFGGQLMDWMEEAALLSVRHVGRGKRWGTVSLDGLEFQQAVAVGESMTFTAVVIKSFGQSCEVFVLAEAESRNGTRRITNDALFTLAFPLEERAEDEDHERQHADSRRAHNKAAESDEDEQRPPLLRQVEMPAGSALETFAQVAVQRRQSRLELKQMLVRIYSDPS